MLTCVMCELWYKAEISKPPSIVKLVAMLTKGSNEAQREVRKMNMICGGRNIRNKQQVWNEACLCPSMLPGTDAA